MVLDDSYATHEVFNQVPAFAGRNLFQTDPLLVRLAQEVIDRERLTDLMDYGGLCGAADLIGARIWGSPPLRW